MESFILGSEWDLIFFLVLFHRPFKMFLKFEFLKNLPFEKKITKTVHYLGLTYGKLHSGI
jgi:hypothetical protein